MRRRTWVSCTKCGYKLHYTSGRPETYFGDPHTTCPQCGKALLDPWVMELALNPREWYVKHHRRALIFILTLIIPAALFVAIMCLLANANGTIVGITVIVGMICSIVPSMLYKAKTTVISVKQLGFDKAYEESEKRLSDPAYMQELIDSGYAEDARAHILD